MIDFVFISFSFCQEDTKFFYYLLIMGRETIGFNQDQSEDFRSGFFTSISRNSNTSDQHF